MKGYGRKLSGSCVDLVVIPNTQSHMNRAWIVFINDPDSGFTLDLVRTAFTDNILWAWWNVERVKGGKALCFVWWTRRQMAVNNYCVLHLLKYDWFSSVRCETLSCSLFRSSIFKNIFPMRKETLIAGKHQSKQWFVALINVLGGAIIGYNSGIVSGLSLPLIQCTLPGFDSSSNVSLYQGIFTSLILVFAAFGSPLGVFFKERLGMKTVALFAMLFM